MENLKRLASAVDQDEPIDQHDQSDPQKKTRSEEIDDCRNSNGFVSGVPFAPSEVLLRLNQGPDGKVDCYTEDDFEWFKKHPERNFMNTPFTDEEKTKIQNVLANLQLKQPVIPSHLREFQLTNALFDKHTKPNQRILFDQLKKDIETHEKLYKITITSKFMNVQEILEAIAENKKALVHVRIEISDIPTIIQIGNMLIKNHKIESLEIIQNNEMTNYDKDEYDEALKALFFILGSIFCRVSALHLKNFDLSRNHTMKALCAAITLRGENMNTYDDLVPFWIIHLPNCQIKGDGFRHLGKMLKTDKHLLSLNIEDNYEGPEPYIELSDDDDKEEVKRNNRLKKEANLFFNGLSSIFDSFASFKDNETLKSLNVSNCNLFHYPITESIDNSLPFSKIEYFYMDQIPENHDKLTFFPDPVLIPKLISSLERVRNNTLKVLSLNCDVHDDTTLNAEVYQLIFKMLSSNKTIEEISAHGQNFTEKEAKDVMQLLDNNHSLETIVFNLFDVNDTEVFSELYDYEEVIKGLDEPDNPTYARSFIKNTFEKDIEVFLDS